MFAKPLCAADPFDLLLAPEAVLHAVERSECLGQLRRRICRPLDVRGEHDADAKAGATKGETGIQRAEKVRLAAA